MQAMVLPAGAAADTREFASRSAPNQDAQSAVPPPSGFRRSAEEIQAHAEERALNEARERQARKEYEQRQRDEREQRRQAAEDARIEQQDRKHYNYTPPGTTSQWVANRIPSQRARYKRVDDIARDLHHIGVEKQLLLKNHGRILQQIQKTGHITPAQKPSWIARKRN